VIGGTIIGYASFDISDGPDYTPFVPSGPGPPLNRVTGGDPSQIGGDLQVGGSVVLLNPTGLVLPSDAAISTVDLAASSDAAATLEQLGISAPAGADVTLDANGALTITTPGDLVVAGGAPDLPGLTSITLVAGGNITITGALELPPDVALSLDTGSGPPDRSGDGPPGGIVVSAPPLFPPCNHLRPLPPVEQEIGAFSIVATAAQPVEIDVLPWRRNSRVTPGRGVIPLALLGSPDLDVRDVVADSLRLGRGEAAPIGRAFPLRSNRDRYADLLALFRVRDAEIAFGDPMVCLTGETADGTVIEGCDAIDTTPRRRRTR
jgi:filamentous hemagglutinin family protein